MLKRRKGAIELINVLNEGSKLVIIRLEDDVEIFLNSGEKRQLSMPSGSGGGLWLQHEKDSYGSTMVAHMNVAVKYELSQLEEDTEIIITREKISVDHLGFYDRFFIKCKNGIAEEQDYEVQGRDALIKLFRKKARISFFLLAPIYSAEWFVFWGVAAVIIMANTNTWKYWILYAIFVYLLVFFLQELGRKFGKFIRRKKEATDVWEMITEWSDREFIRNYYAKEERKPVRGNIEY